MTESGKFTQFVAAREVTLEAHAIGDWPWPIPKGSGWDCTLRYQDRTMQVKLYGPPGSRPPSAVTALDGLLWDYFTAHSTRDYLEWCDTFGYRKSEEAETNYAAMRKTGEDLERLLGQDIRVFAQVAGLTEAG